MVFSVHVGGVDRVFSDESILRGQLEGIAHGRRVIWFDEVPLELNCVQKFVWILLGIIPSGRHVVFADQYARRNYTILSSMRNHFGVNHPLYSQVQSAYLCMNTRFHPPVAPRTFTWMPVWRPRFSLPTFNLPRMRFPSLNLYNRGNHFSQQSSYAGVGANRPPRDLAGRGEYRADRRNGGSNSFFGFGGLSSAARPFSDQRSTLAGTRSGFGFGGGARSVLPDSRQAGTRR